VLHYIGSSGSVRYSTDGGATWVSTIALTGAGALTTALTLPATAHSLVLEVVTGPVQICGVDLRSTAAGVRVHKLGSTGSTAAQWATTNNASALTALGPDLVTVLLGTNDQGGSRTASQFSADLATITARIKTALPQADILFICPCENNRVANTFPMTAYAAEMEKVALLNKAAYINLQYSFGTTPAEYAFGSARPWMASDLIHPDPTSGGRAILSDIVRIIEVQ
jgi:lysophospholipase L1-like esterase